MPSNPPRSHPSVSQKETPTNIARHPLGATLGPAAIGPRRQEPLLVAEIIRLLERHGVPWGQAVREAAGLMAQTVEEAEGWWAFEMADEESPSDAEMIVKKRAESASLPAVPANLNQALAGPEAPEYVGGNVWTQRIPPIPPTASPDQDFLKLLDDLISKAIFRGRDESSTQGRLINGSYESRQKAVHAARQSLVDYLEGIRAERDRLRSVLSPTPTNRSK